MADKKETTEKAEEVRRSGNIYISYLNDPTVPASKPDFVDECSALDPALSELTPLTSISEVNGTTGVLELGEVATAPAPLAKQAIEPATAPREDFGNCDSPADPMEEPVSVITEEVRLLEVIFCVPNPHIVKSVRRYFVGLVFDDTLQEI